MIFHTTAGVYFLLVVLVYCSTIKKIPSIGGNIYATPMHFINTSMHLMFGTHCHQYTSEYCQLHPCVPTGAGGDGAAHGAIKSAERIFENHFNKNKSI